MTPCSIKEQNMRESAMKQCINSQSAGSVMMEFVLVFPVYLLLFGGVFWVGELFHAQAMRLTSERAAAWSYGLRENRPSSVLGTLMRPDVNNWTLETMAGRATQGRYLADTKQSWAQVVGASFSVNYRASTWTEGWFQSGRVLFGESAGSPLGAVLGQGRNTVYDHVVVMRTRGGDAVSSLRRRWTAKGSPHLGDKGLVPTGAEWYKVVNEEYPYDNGSPALGSGDDGFTYDAPKNEDYQRFHLLYSWGNHRGFQVWDMGLDAIEAVKDVVDLF